MELDNDKETIITPEGNLTCRQDVIIVGNRATSSLVAHTHSPVRTENETTKNSGNIPASVTNHIKGKQGAYLKVSIQGRKFHALLDTGSEISLIPIDAIPPGSLRKSEQILHATNGTDIEVLGEASLSLRIGELEIPFDCVVVRDVSEVLLGLDWMVKYVDHLDFKEKTIVVEGHKFLLSQSPKSMGQKVVCAQALVLPARSEVNIEGRMIQNERCHDKWYVDKRKKVKGETPTNWIHDGGIGTTDSCDGEATQGPSQRHSGADRSPGYRPATQTQTPNQRPQRIRKKPDRWGYCRRNFCCIPCCYHSGPGPDLNKCNVLCFFRKTKMATNRQEIQQRQETRERKKQRWKTTMSKRPSKEGYLNWDLCRRPNGDSQCPKCDYTSAHREYASRHHSRVHVVKADKSIKDLRRVIKDDLESDTGMEQDDDSTGSKDLTELGRGYDQALRSVGNREMGTPPEDVVEVTQIASERLMGIEAAKVPSSVSTNQSGESVVFEIYKQSPMETSQRG